MSMDVLAIVIATIAITLGSMYLGYRLAMYQQQMKDIKWWSEMTFDDMMSDAPIYNKLSREYGFYQ
jgi:hypothetical protein